MAIVTEIIIGVGVSLLAQEVIANAPRITRWLVMRAVRGLPEKDRDRFSEEWLSHAEELPGSLAKLHHGLACYVHGVRRIVRYRNAPDLRHLNRTALAVIRLKAWAGLLRVDLKFIVVMGVRGQFRRIKLSMQINRLLVSTLMHGLRNGHSIADVRTALDARSNELKEIFERHLGTRVRQDSKRSTTTTEKADTAA
ncbi:hypothetical protein QMZ05_16650 [Bradyrhizobium sp. INPA03-11B]|uniref:hypothetical protein n=1 Tax=Bradyrhizobium sp. INPA03-11B TaxID=418598 RepID=UPI00338DF81C